MIDEETFIRAVVDRPGDDTPRLMYADWLDDRADPRGAYLRAERAAVAARPEASLAGQLGQHARDQTLTLGPVNPRPGRS